jgi:hypothetical protein
MKASGIHELKSELGTLSEKELREIILKLARFKKENKELLSYLLFESGNITGFVNSVKAEMDDQFSEINHLNHYYIKKSLRKILRNISRYARYMGDERAEADLLIYFCSKVRACKIPVLKGTVLGHIYHNQVSKIRKLIKTLHEDLQYDYENLLDKADQ